MKKLSITFLAKLLDTNGAEQRAIHLNTGDLGQLFVDLSTPISKLRCANYWYTENINGEREVFDTLLGEWVPLAQSMINIIPDTYTFAPRPVNIDMELDYFVRGSGLINHSFIWATQSIPKDIFAMIATHTNYSFHGRYTVTPWVPKMKNLGEMVKDFYVMNDNDWNFMYGNQNKKH